MADESPGLGTPGKVSHITLGVDKFSPPEEKTYEDS